MPVIINGSTGISGNDGTAAVPTIQGTDGNTGMFFPAADQIAFAEGGVEAMRLDASGNVGIGTSSPGERLVVAGGTDVFQTWRNNTGVVGAASANGSASSFQVYTASNHPLMLGTNNTERARITPAGNFGIGTTSPNSLLDVRGSAIISTNTNAPGTTGWQGAAINGTVGSLELSRNGSNVAAFYHTSNAGGTGGSPVGTISITTTNTSYNTSSDYRLKENVVRLTDAATRLGALKPSRFNFISDPSRTFDGFLAHEAAEVVPEAVTGEKDEVNEDGKPVYQGIDHSKLVPLLTAALQEALTEIAALKARVAALEATP